MNKVEILSPAGCFESLQAAHDGGADAIYLGIGDLNMRSRNVNNFTFEDLDEIVKRCKEKQVKVYVTLNTVMYEEDLLTMRTVCEEVKKAGIDAIIAHDIAVILYARSIGLKTHISTQANVSNIEAVKYYSQFADVIVLARELNLEQIKSICDAICHEEICGPSGGLVKIEVFVHGALCVAISGKCYMSLALHDASANRGGCYQVCRRKYRVIEEDGDRELVLDNQYIMSPKDLCTIAHLDQIIHAGVSVLKIEGRGKASEYVYTVTECYKRAVESILEGSYTKDKIDKWQTQLDSVFNRGFWQGGYYLGNKLGEWSNSYGSQATMHKTYIGKVSNYFAKSKVAEFKLEAGSVKEGDHVLISGSSTGVVKMQIPSLREYEDAKITFSTLEKVRRNDKLYLLQPRKKELA